MVINIGVGAGPAGLVLAGPPFRRFNNKNCACSLCAAITAGPFQSPSYTPDKLLLF